MKTKEITNKMKYGKIYKFPNVIIWKLGEELKMNPIELMGFFEDCGIAMPLGKIIQAYYENNGDNLEMDEK